MVSIENQIKQQFAKLFSFSDWKIFKLLAEYYLSTATQLRKKDIDVPEPFKLLVRNSQKRLFIGVGCELLLKAFFLKNGYCINKIDKDYSKANSLSPPYRINSIEQAHLLKEYTFTFNQLLEQISKIPTFKLILPSKRSDILQGFKIAKVFRNKEGHTTTLWHKFDTNNYSDIEKSLEYFYEIGFSEQLKIQFSMKKNEPNIFKTKPLLSSGGGLHSH